MAVARLSRPDWLAAELLLIVAAREHLWALAPAQHQGVVSKMLGACMALVLLSVVYRLAQPSALLHAVLAVGAWAQLQAILCTLAFILKPWAVLPGQGMCSARVDFDLGALGLLGVAWIAWRLTVRPDRLPGGSNG